MAKGKKGQAAEPAASRNSSMDVYRPTIQHIISDHAGTVLDENKPEPEPDLTVSAKDGPQVTPHPPPPRSRRRSRRRRRRTTLLTRVTAWTRRWCASC